MEVNPNNPVVKLCSEGLAAEMAGKVAEALDLYTRAWDARKDDYDACIAAHYVARLQKTPEDALRWNRQSLNAAKSVGEERVGGFYPSLYLNMGKSHEDLGNFDEARRYYRLAEAKLGVLGEGPYADTVRKGVTSALMRVAGNGSGPG